MTKEKEREEQEEETGAAGGQAPLSPYLAGREEILDYHHT